MSSILPGSTSFRGSSEMRCAEPCTNVHRDMTQNWHSLFLKRSPLRGEADASSRSSTGRRSELPSEVAKWMLTPFVVLGGTVLAPFGGSGTTLMAAEASGRRAALIELDARYVDVIVRRWEGGTGRQALLEQSGIPFEAVAAERSTGPANVSTTAEAAA